MASPIVTIPDDLNKVLSERADVWRAHDAARANMDKINSQVSKVGERHGRGSDSAAY